MKNETQVEIVIRAKKDGKRYEAILPVTNEFKGYMLDNWQESDIPTSTKKVLLNSLRLIEKEVDFDDCKFFAHRFLEHKQESKGLTFTSKLTVELKELN